MISAAPFFQVGELFVDGFEGCGRHFFVVEDLPSLLWGDAFLVEVLRVPIGIGTLRTTGRLNATKCSWAT